VAEGAQRLASQVAYTLVELLPSTASPAEVASMAAQVIGRGDPAETRAAADILQQAVASIEDAPADLRGAAKSDAYERLATWISGLLARGDVTTGELEQTEAAVRAAASGVGALPPGPPVVVDDDDDGLPSDGPHGPSVTDEE
jgi:hypothetical protein